MKRLFNFLKLTAALGLLISGCTTNTKSEQYSFSSDDFITSSSKQETTTSDSTSDKPSSTSKTTSSSSSSSSKSSGSSSSSRSSSSSSNSSKSSSSSSAHSSSSIPSSSSSSIPELKYYTVTWKNYDGTTLEVDTTVLEGTMPEYNGNTPSRSTDSQYIYYFHGWSPDLSPVTANVTYTATYTTELRSFTITWVDGNGATLEVDENVPYGTTPHYDGETPTKASTDQYTYSFTSWSPEVVPVVGNATYTAQFSNTVRTFTITWVNGDVIEQDDNVPYGTTPSYDGETPTKASNNQYTYTFAGWYPAVVPVVGNATYTAQFEAHTRVFTVTWKDYNGDTLEVDHDVPYGTMPSYDGVEPSREYDSHYYYFFDGWSPTISEVTKDVTYTAKYRSEVRTYTIIWKNYSGSVLETDNNVPYGANPSYDGTTPTRPSTAEFSYTFTGWSPVVSSVVGDAIYTAQFEAAKRTYTVTWKNYDNSVLETDNNVPYGTEPVYNGERPTKESTEQYDYYFDGWSPEVTTVVGDATYVATYSAVQKTFTITWKNYDHTVLEIDEDVPYGTTPTYDGSTPSKPSTNQYNYVFSGWSPNVSPVTDHTVYTATFNQVQRTYTITWKNYDGTVLETDNATYGSIPTYDGATPTRSSTAQYSYSFSGWSPAVSAVTANAIYTATYTANVRTYTVTWKNYDGTTLETDNGVTYGTTPTYNGSLPTRTATSSYNYYFSNWSPIVSEVTGNVTYTAQYEAVAVFNYSLRSYSFKSGYSVSTSNGRPWIDVLKGDEIETINKPYLETDFYANVNYDKLVADEYGPYEKAGNYTNSVTSQIMSLTGNRNPTNAPVLRRMRSIIYNGDASGISTYLNNINIDNYVASKQLFNSYSSLVDLLAVDNGGYEIRYNDGYLNNKRTGIPYLMFWSEYSSGTDYITPTTNVLKSLSNMLSLGFSDADIEDIFTYGGNKLARTVWNYNKQTAYTSFTVNTIPWAPVKSALLDLGLTSSTSVRITAGNIAVFNALFNDYLVNNKTVISNYLKARLAFDYRYLLGYSNYQTLNAYYKNLSCFNNESSYGNLSDYQVEDYFTQITLREVLENCYLEETGQQYYKNVTSNLIVSCINEYKLLIQENDWLDSSTKEAAIRKLNNMKYEALYSDAYKNMGEITISNLSSASAFSIMQAVENRKLSLAAQHLIENDTGTWMTYHSYTVNGFYLPSRNLFLVCNALTGGGFMGYDSETRYAMIGSVIAHEISHAFDGSGANYDETGASVDWWSNNDKLEFKAKVQKVYDFYSGIYMDQTNKVNGSTVGNEAIADMGAVRVLLRLGAKLSSFDYEKFFNTYAALWHHARLTGTYYTNRIKDTHPMNYLRCNVTVAQFEEFYTTFNITEGDGMYIPPANRVAIW